MPCNECKHVHIGQNGKTLDERIKQHKTAKESSAIFKHDEKRNHCNDWKSDQGIYKSSCVERVITESALIRTNNTMNLNDG